MSVFPLAAEPLARSYPPANARQAWVDLVESSEGSGQYLLEILTYIGGITRSGGLATVAEIPVASNPPNAGVNTGQVTLKYADRHWVGGTGVLASSDYGSIATAPTFSSDYGSIT